MVAIGIDLGTTFCCVAVYRYGRLEVIRNAQENRVTPSFLAYRNGHKLVGDEAKAQALTNPENTIYESKRLIGRHFSDESVQSDIRRWPFRVVSNNNIPEVVIQNPSGPLRLRAEQVSAAILTELRAYAENFLGQEVKEAVITVPAYFSDSQRQATKDAARDAGLTVLRLINEPTAAAIAYGLENVKGDVKKTVLIFDLGGGTLDVSVMCIEDGIFDVQSTNGDTRLGGEDFTNRLVDHCCEEFYAECGIDITKDRRALFKLKTECERVKMILSYEKEKKVKVHGLFGTRDFVTRITREQFERLNNDLFKRTLKPVVRALKDAKLQSHQIDDVVLVGGSTRIPMIQKMLRDLFGKDKKLNDSVNPDEAVALGAAIQAAKLAGDDSESDALQEVVLIDVTPKSLGLEILGGQIDVVIPRNTTIPCSAKKLFSTFYDGQTRLEFIVYEGEREMAKDNNQLGKLILDDITPRPRLEPDIDVTFSVNVDGILEVTAVERSCGRERQLTTKLEKGIVTQTDIEMLKQENQMFQVADKIEKERVTARVKLEDLCLRYQNSLKYESQATSMRPDEAQRLTDLCANVLKWLKANENARKDDFTEKIHHLEREFNRHL